MSHGTYVCIRTDVGRFLGDGSHRAEAPMDVRLVFLGEAVERAAVQIVPRRLDADLVVMRHIVHLIEHHRHSRLLPLHPRRRRRSRRVCTRQ